MAATIDYDAHIRSESARFAAALAAADPAARVPTCPDWDAAELLWHLTEVQFFWATIVREQLSEPDAAEAHKPDRPSDLAASLALFDDATRALLDALAANPDETVVWTWADHTVGFIRRWQATEALAHRLDAEIVSGTRTGIDPQLASDAIGAALTYEYGSVPEWGAFDPNGPVGVVEATDTKQVWPIQVGRFTGTGPESGTVYDRDVARISNSSAAPAFTLRGDAADLVTWLIGRGSRDTLAVEGDREAFAKFEAVIARGLE